MDGKALDGAVILMLEVCVCVCVCGEYSMGVKETMLTSPIQAACY